MTPELLMMRHGTNFKSIVPSHSHGQANIHTVILIYETFDVKNFRLYRYWQHAKPILHAFAPQN